MLMIDIHCHILPNFDDGASSLEESLQMVRMAHATGVSAIVSTPHFPGRPDFLNRLPVVMELYRMLRDAISREGIPLKLLPGAEILCLPETPQMARQRDLPTIGDTDYLLAEFYFDESANYMNDMLLDLARAGYRPVVAHPERYRAVQQDPALAEFWFRQGYVLQINKGSLLGSFGGRVETTAAELLEQGLAHLIASDAHGIMSRTTHMTALNHYLRDRCDEAYTEILLKRNPGRLIENRDMVPIL
jgi:protein-tyrosine phosphatase